METPVYGGTSSTHITAIHTYIPHTHTHVWAFVHRNLTCRHVTNYPSVNLDSLKTDSRGYYNVCELFESVQAFKQIYRNKTALAAFDQH